MRNIQKPTERLRLAMYILPLHGHLGVKTIARVKERFTRKGTVEDVSEENSEYIRGFKTSTLLSL